MGKKIMRRLLLIIGVLLCTSSVFADEYIINERTKDISKVPTERTIKKDTTPPYNTGWTFEGQPVYISKNGKGSAYIIKYKKSDGTPYYKYLGKELTKKYKRLCGLPIDN